MRKICVVTGTRAEYGLLYWLMKEIEASNELELQLIVTGMHLAPEFGLTFQHIEKDGFRNNKKVEMLLSSDSEVGVTKSMGLGMIGFADAFNELRPDMLVLLGDRFELLSAASAALIFRIPIVHIHGGETTEGAFDEAIRHSITKMSHLHFTATEQYRKRVIQLGEYPERVFNVGGTGIDNITRLDLLSKEELEKGINFQLDKKNLLVTYHPVTLEMSTAQQQFAELLLALDDLSDTCLVFTKANSDTNGRIINEMIDNYVDSNTDKSIAFTSMGQLRYLSTMQYVDGVIGNSSSGLLEAPTFKIGTINIGDRQKGRIQAASVINCHPTKESISKGIDRLFSKDFREQLKTVENPYGHGGAARKCVDAIQEYCKIDIKKSFYDME